MPTAKSKQSPAKHNSGQAWWKPFIIPGVVALALIGIVLVFVPGEIDRFTLIMPIFAGYILYMILTAVEDEEEK